MQAVKFILASALALGLGAASALAMEVEVRNETKTKITHLFLSPPGQQKFDEDQLGENSDDSIDANDTYTMEEIDAGTYDLKIVAEDGTACMLPDVRFAEGKGWTITEALLAACVKMQ